MGDSVNKGVGGDRLGDLETVGCDGEAHPPIQISSTQRPNRFIIVYFQHGKNPTLRLPGLSHLCHDHGSPLENKTMVVMMGGFECRLCV